MIGGLGYHETIQSLTSRKCYSQKTTECGTDDAFKLLPRQLNYQQPYEVVYVTIGNHAFCLTLYLTGIQLRGELLHTGHVGEQKTKCRTIKI